MTGLQFLDTGNGIENWFRTVLIQNIESRISRIREGGLRNGLKFVYIVHCTCNSLVSPTFHFLQTLDSHFNTEIRIRIGIELELEQNGGQYIIKRKNGNVDHPKWKTHTHTRTSTNSGFWILDSGLQIFYSFCFVPSSMRRNALFFTILPFPISGFSCAFLGKVKVYTYYMYCNTPLFECFNIVMVVHTGLVDRNSYLFLVIIFNIKRIIIIFQVTEGTIQVLC